MVIKGRTGRFGGLPARRAGLPALAVVVLLAVVGCSAATSAPTQSAESSTPASPSVSGSVASPGVASPAPTAAVAKSPTVSGKFAVGGVQMWLDCQGTGPATYVIIPGLHSTAADWTEVLPGMRKQTRTCIYDRPGLGHSPARTSGSTNVDAAVHAKELAALLKAAKEPGPFIPMGHSYGGLIARAFALQQAPSVVGVFLPEGVAPGYYSEGTSWSEANTSVSLISSSKATEGLNLGDKPLLVMSGTVADRDYLNGSNNGTDAARWRADQAAAVKLSTNSIRVIAESAHVLQQDNPKAVLLATKVLLDAVVDHSKLNCKADWQAVDADCIPGR